jgi:hypothetical protein
MHMDMSHTRTCACTRTCHTRGYMHAHTGISHTRNHACTQTCLTRAYAHVWRTYHTRTYAHAHTDMSHVHMRIPEAHELVVHLGSYTIRHMHDPCQQVPLLFDFQATWNPKRQLRAHVQLWQEHSCAFFLAVTCQHTIEIRQHMNPT